MNTPTEPGIYFARLHGGQWVPASLIKTGLPQPSTKCDILVLPDNRNFDVRDYVTNYVGDGWEFRKAELPK